MGMRWGWRRVAAVRRCAALRALFFVSTGCTVFVGSTVLAVPCLLGSTSTVCWEYCTSRVMFVGEFCTSRTMFVGEYCTSRTVFVLLASAQGHLSGTTVIRA